MRDTWGGRGVEMTIKRSWNQNKSHHPPTHSLADTFMWTHTHARIRSNRSKKRNFLQVVQIRNSSDDNGAGKKRRNMPSFDWAVVLKHCSAALSWQRLLFFDALLVTIITTPQLPLEPDQRLSFSAWMVQRSWFEGGRFFYCTRNTLNNLNDI